MMRDRRGDVYGCDSNGGGEYGRDGVVIEMLPSGLDPTSTKDLPAQRPRSNQYQRPSGADAALRRISIVKPRKRPVHPIIRVLPNNRRFMARTVRMQPTRDLGDLVCHVDTPPDKSVQ
ncbi:hypothetical protein Tco_0482387 [Tanacetum coccineum]